MTIKKICPLLLMLISPVYAQDSALLVGIDEYQNASTLKGSKQDVKDMWQLLKSVWGFQSHQIRTLTDAQATRNAILNAFDNWLIKGSRRGDRVLFYFSGHGSHTNDRNGDESDGYDEILLPVDFPHTMITDDEINARLQRLKGRQVMVVIDACHSGTITRSIANPTIKVPVFHRLPKLTRSFNQPHIERDGFIATQQNVIAYSAVAPNQVALVDTENPYRGVFTSRFIQGIQQKRADNNHDGKVSHAELLDYVRRESQAYCDRHPGLQCTLGKLSPQLEAKPEMLAVDARTWNAPRTINTAEQAISVLSHNNQANLHLNILPRSSLKIGDSMKIQIHSAFNGYLLLFDINSAGDLTRLFPNKYTKRSGKQGYIKARQTITIPDWYYGFEFITEEPLGKGLLIALLVEDNITKFQTLLPRAFKQVHARQAQAVLQQLRQQLNQTLLEKNAEHQVVNRPVRWSLAVVDYDIVR